MKQLFTMATFLALTAFSSAQEAKPKIAEPIDMAAMMEKAKRFTEPGEEHKLLERFIGQWTMETRFNMGGKESPAAVGEQTCQWLMKGRWVECRSKGPLLGAPHESVTIIGYDRFKQSYRVMTVNTIDTAMNTSEGDMDPGGQALITYGTVDEYLTGEHDKMVRYVWRFDDANTIRMEVHDLPIGEKNTQVVSMRYTRKAAR